VRLQPTVRAAIEAIEENAWVELPELPEELDRADRRDHARRPPSDRPPRPHLDRQGELLPTWELVPFITNRTDALTTVEAEHRQHAVVELAIRDLKGQALAHFPSGHFYANAAWTLTPRSRTTCCAGPASSASPTTPFAPRARPAADGSPSPVG
jgi:hypothetical protein